MDKFEYTDTYNYFSSHTLKTFYELQELLVSDIPIGSGTYSAKASSLALNINHTLEYLISEKEEEVCKLFGFEVDRGKRSKKPKNQIMDRLCSSNIRYAGMNIDGEIFRLIADICDASKHREIGRNDRVLTSHSQVKESLFLLMNQTQNEPFYSIHKGVFVVTDENRIFNLEPKLNLAMLLLYALLFDLRVVTSSPNLQDNMRNFNITASEADKTFIVHRHLIEIPAHTVWKDTPPIRQVFDKRCFQSIRAPIKGEKFNIKLTLARLVTKNPLISK